MSESKIIDKIRKLLALSNQDNPEGALAAEKARQIMLEYAIEIRDIPLDRQWDTDPIEKVDRDIETKHQWRRALFNVIAIHCDVRVLTIQATKTMNVFGNRSNIAVMDYLYDIAVRWIEKQAAIKYKKPGSGMLLFNKGAPAEVGRVPVDYYESAVSGLSNKLADIRKASDAANPVGTSLVLHRAEAVEDWMEKWLRDHGMRITHTKRTFKHNADGYKAGQDTPIQSGIGGGKPNGQIGKKD